MIFYEYNALPEEYSEEESSKYIEDLDKSFNTLLTENFILTQQDLVEYGYITENVITDFFRHIVDFITKIANHVKNSYEVLFKILRGTKKVNDKVNDTLKHPKQSASALGSKLKKNRIITINGYEFRLSVNEANIDLIGAYPKANLKDYENMDIDYSLRSLPRNAFKYELPAEFRDKLANPSYTPKQFHSDFKNYVFGEPKEIQTTEAQAKSDDKDLDKLKKLVKDLASKNREINRQYLKEINKARFNFLKVKQDDYHGSDYNIAVTNMRTHLSAAAKYIRDCNMFALNTCTVYTDAIRTWNHQIDMIYTRALEQTD